MEDVFDVELRLKRNEYLVAADVKAPHRSRPRPWCPKGVPQRRRGSNRQRERSPAKRAQTPDKTTLVSLPFLGGDQLCSSSCSPSAAFMASLNKPDSSYASTLVLWAIGTFGSTALKTGAVACSHSGVSSVCGCVLRFVCHCALIFRGTAQKWADARPLRAT